MDVVLIPGFWLEASSWAPVTAALAAAGHTPHPVTPLGTGRPAAEVAATTLADQAADVVALVDTLPGPVVVVGHSGGGAVAHAVADARPDRVARVVYVDSGPIGDGDVVNAELPVVDGVVPFPGWDAFGPEELEGLTPELRERLEGAALTVPPLVAAGPQRLHDERRYDVPVTVISCTMPEPVLRALVAEGHPYVAELGRVRDVEVVELPTGHWPQLSRPEDLAAAVVAAVGGAARTRAGAP
ncbi:alpha/beta fold hydrolase [Cellulomonas marina]|uniref:Pimeloyl-ACP methyl ester carboxylesterase n=1 Tax=Cellulomonas marina TaxID=988821 RepID=A0A1I0W6X2_9CELL|nr:alpha/beta fold hydrolase [Cellulomonas marina]GIG30510.1 esterase [Cellulomonas marina]SFA84057.1 Pimeloyl-ACP methyl ester carboxylesterase [Cellulomonas marina]